MNDVIISCVPEQRLLEVNLDMPFLTWHQHIQDIISDGYRRVNLMKALSSTFLGASSKILRLFYVAYIQSKMEYALVIFIGVVTPFKRKLKVQNICFRLVLRARNRLTLSYIYSIFKMMQICKMVLRHFSTFTTFFNIQYFVAICRLNASDWHSKCK